MTNPLEDPQQTREIAERKIERAEPVSFEYLRDHFFGEEFQRMLKGTIEHFIIGDKREAGFGIVRDLGSTETVFTSIMRSENDNPDEYAYDEAFLRLEKKMRKLGKKTLVRMGSLHTHFESTETFALSPSSMPNGDLGNASMTRARNRKKFGFDVIPIEIVAAPSLDDKEFSLVIFREPEHFTLSMKAMPASRKELDDALMHINDQQEVLDEMRRYQYIVELLRTKDHRIQVSDIEKLRPFAYTPKPVELRP